MTERLQIILAAACLGVALFAAPAATQELDPMDDSGRLDEVAKLIDLDDATRAQIAAISQDVAEDNAPRRAEMRKERLLLRALLENTPPDDTAVMAQVDKLTALQNALWKRRLRAMMEMRALLTPLQREQLVQLRQREAGQSSRACRGDVRALCPGVVDMRTAIGCLIEKRDQISDGCRDQLSQGRLSRFFESDAAR